MTYLLLLLIGGIGFAAMTLLGVVAQGHGGPRAHHGGGGHSLRIGHHGATGGAHHGAAHGQGGTHHAGAVKAGATKGHASNEGRFSMLWLSPLDIFSFCIGAGAAGMLFQKLLSGNWLIAAAILGALVFNFAVIKPIMNTLLKFASRESEGLEGSVAKSAEAITRFDAQGRGLVKLCLDGQYVQLLATLENDERDRGVLVAKGDPVMIVDVDPARNTCRVTRELT